MACVPLTLAETGSIEAVTCGGLRSAAPFRSNMIAGGDRPSQLQPADASIHCVTPSNATSSSAITAMRQPEQLPPEMLQLLDEALDDFETCDNGKDTFRWHSLQRFRPRLQKIHRLSTGILAGRAGSTWGERSVL